MLKWIKNLGYPETIKSTTRFSPSSYPTLSLQVGRDTEIACAVKGGTGKPKVSCWSLRVSVAVRLILGYRLAREEMRTVCEQVCFYERMSRKRGQVLYMRPPTAS